jgi:hypothetical protein
MSDLEARVTTLEEELAIYRLVASYGPAIDALASGGQPLGA